MRIGRTLPPAAAPIYIKDILSGLKGTIHGSKEINRLESELKEYYNVSHCFLVSSGKAALTIILKALHKIYPERNEVLIPAYTCYSVPSAIVKAGLKVKLCDINPETLDFDSDELKKILFQSDNRDAKKNKILAILPTHLFGLPADVEQMKKISDEFDITVIEDSAQAMGGMLKGKKLGTLCEAGFFSLGRGKALSTVEGGIILTNNKNIADKIAGQIKTISEYKFWEVIKLFIFSIILNVFMRPAFFWFPKSLPFLKLGETIFESEFPLKKMSYFQAGLAKNWQAKLMSMSSVRRQKTSQLILAFQKNKNLRSQLISQDGNRELLRFPLRIYEEKILNRVLSQSELLGCGVMRGYPDSINNIKELKTFFKGKSYPKATRISRQLITLPVNPSISISDSLRIIKLIGNESGF